MDVDVHESVHKSNEYLGDILEDEQVTGFDPYIEALGKAQVPR